MAKEITIMMVGDIYISTPDAYPRVPQVVPIPKTRPDLYSWIKKVAPRLQQGDFTLGNLEGPICEPVIADPGLFPYGDLSFEARMPPEAADVLKRAGFSALSIANNHTMDIGAKAMLETLHHLDRAGIAHPGGGRNISEARQPAILKRAGIRLAFLSYSSVFEPNLYAAGENKAGIATVAVATSYEIGPNIGYSPGVLPRVITRPNPVHVAGMLKDVRRAKAVADLVVVSWHWGTSKYAQSAGSGLPFEDTPFFVLNYQEEMGRAAIDAGADVVMGHHPHRLQGMEVYKERLICYSLSHLVMSFGEGLNFGPESVIVKACVDAGSKRLTRFAIIPLLVPPDLPEPHIVPMSQAAPFAAELQRLSKKYGTGFQVADDDIVIKAGAPGKLLSALKA